MTMRAFLIAILVGLLVPSLAYGQSAFQPNFFPGYNPPKARHVVEPSKATLDDLFPKSEIPDVTLQPLDLSRAKLPDLHTASIEKLASYYFVQVNDIRLKQFADIYKQ